jgi:hypothetical protein
LAGGAVATGERHLDVARSGAYDDATRVGARAPSTDLDESRFHRGADGYGHEPQNGDRGRPDSRGATFGCAHDVLGWCK